MAKEEADRMAKEEADRMAKEEADRMAKEEADRMAKEEADRMAKEEVQCQSAADAARIGTSSTCTDLKSSSCSAPPNPDLQWYRRWRDRRRVPHVPHHLNRSLGAEETSGSTAAHHSILLHLDATMVGSPSPSPSPKRVSFKR